MIEHAWFDGFRSALFVPTKKSSGFLCKTWSNLCTYNLLSKPMHSFDVNETAISIVHIDNQGKVVKVVLLLHVCT